MNKPRICAVVAIGKNRELGKNGKLLWHIPDDLKRFKELTMGHPVIMGRKTFESIVSYIKGPLSGRTNIVITRQADYAPEGVEIVRSFTAALHAVPSDEEVFVIGGGEIFKIALPLADRVYLTRVEADVAGDVFFPELDPKEWREASHTEGVVDEKNPYPHTFILLEKKR